MVCSKEIFNDPFYKPFEQSQLGAPKWCPNMPEGAWTQENFGSSTATAVLAIAKAPTSRI